MAGKRSGSKSKSRKPKKIKKRASAARKSKPRRSARPKSRTKARSKARVKSKRSTADSSSSIFASSAFGARFWQGASWGIAMIAAIIFLIRAFGGFSFGELALRGPTVWGYAALWGAVFVFVGLFEEFLFRGYTQFTLADGIGFWPAAILLSGSFGYVHLKNPGEGPIGAAAVMTIGLVFALTLRRTGNLWLAVGWHASFDFGETFLFSVPNSGIVFEGHLSNASLHGAKWLTGGTVGPEGSVFSFLTMAILALVVHRLYPARSSNPNPN